MICCLVLLFKRLNFAVKNLLPPFFSLIHLVFEIKKLILPGKLSHVDCVLNALNLYVCSLLDVIEGQLLSIGCHFQFDLEGLAPQFKILEVLFLRVNLPRSGFLN